MKTHVFLSISFSVFLLTSFANVAFAQSDFIDKAKTMTNQQQQGQPEEEETDNKTVKYVIVKDQGLSLGVDLSPIIMRLINDERTGLAFIGRYGLKNRLFAGAEVGYEHIKYNNDSYKYNSDGSFVRIGLDYDIFNNEDYPSNNNIFVGFRYAYAWQTHKSDAFTIVDSYWGDYSGSVGRSSVNSHSLDLLSGLRCEVLPNIYMGWSFRVRFLLASTHSDNLKPYAVAGYGKYDSRVTMGFTYTVEYQIPINKLRGKIK